jgi:molybdopterin-guanine dinucleotide biosynthesis protein A
MKPPIPANAFVLAGGESRRFSGDKAIQDWRGKPLIQHIIDTLSTCFETTIVVAQSDQAYHAALSAPVIHDQIPNCGPLGGIHAALSTSETDWNFVVACDMPFVNENVIRELWLHHTTKALAIVPQVEERFIPTLGFYHRQALGALEDDLKHERLAVYRWLKSIQTEVVSEEDLRIVDPYLQSIVNVNTLEDRERALRMLEQIEEGG